MATAASFVSESGDHYLFAMDDLDPTFSVEAFCDGLAKMWWCSEVEYPNVAFSDAFDIIELRRAINTLLAGEL